MKRLVVVMMVLCVGCKPKPDPYRAPVVENEDEFTNSDWEDLTESLLVSGREGDVETFKSHVSEETQKMFEESWQPIRDKCDRGLDHDGITYEDRDRLLQLKDGCTWEALAKNYRPGRLITITPMEGGGYRVKEILPAGRKVDYIVREGKSGWEITYEQDARWFRQLEAVAHSLVNGILEKYGLKDLPPQCTGEFANDPDKGCPPEVEKPVEDGIGKKLEIPPELQDGAGEKGE